MRNGRVSGLLVLTLILARPAAPQPPADQAPQPPTFRAGVGAVRVDVTVNGRDGLPILDLTREDFEVREDGAVQRVQLFQQYRLTGEPPEDSDESLTIRSPDHARQEAAREDVRLLVIFLDDYHLKYGPLEDTRVRRDLVQFVQKEIRPLDLVAVMGPLTPLTDLGLTRDRAALLERINALQGRLGGFVPPRSAIEESHLRLGPGQLARVRAQISLSALEAAAVHLSGLREGRKSILFVSQGPPIRASAELFDGLRDVIVAANRGNVTIHTLDPRQLGDARMISDANEALAADTGGRRMGLSNDFTRALRSVMADASVYYLLGYESPSTMPDGKFREIDVRVRRPGARVIARKGYWAPKAEELRTAATAAAAAARVAPEVAMALDSLKDQTRRIAVTDWMGFGPVTGDRSEITLVLEAIAHGATAPRIGAIEVEVTTPDGTKTAHVPARDAGGTWTLVFDSRPGTIRTRVVVRDPDGEVIDSWARELAVPAATDAAAPVGTPAVFRPTSVLQYRALAAGARISPTPVRRFRRTDRAIVRLPLRAGHAPVDVQLLNRQGVPLKTLTAVPAPVPDAVQVEVPLGNLAQADYVLRFLVTSPAARTTRLVPFTLTP